MTPSDYAERYAALQASIDKNIHTHGWHATAVFPTQDDVVEDNPPFIYTVGLAEKGLPEVLVFGDADNFHGVLATAVERLTKGELRPVPQRAGFVLVGLDVFLLEMRPELWPNYLGTALGRAEGRTEGFRALQLVWPDAQNRFPWEDDYDLPAWYQPILGDIPEG